MTFEKIGAQHLARKAVVYVRQSSAHQVLHNRDGQALQYAMRGRLMQLGWSEIEIIDDDLGRFAAGGVARAGFERMVAEVCPGKVGAVSPLAYGHRRDRSAFGFPGRPAAGTCGRLSGSPQPDSDDGVLGWADFAEFMGSGASDRG